MFPEPLHPAVVHFPIVFATVLPFLAALVLWRLHDGAPLRTWGPVALVAVLTWGTAYLVARTGGSEEERVEAVLASEAPLHEHEEAAEWFLVVSGIAAGLALLGFAPGLVGRGARLLALVGAVAGLAAAARTGVLGGELVYQHGAAAAYTTASPNTPAPSPAGEEPEDDDRP
ncbi:MAG: hypothetical protein OEW06_04180 [Gemmatimonadota bacterium]|nr:hypothetical protein [Gemmatimonadota bacterium]MDH4352120.1 hypothetical protein [Gemmatimonadota bacterium]